jgi:cbb3-type cytochrome oxidase subunit 3
MDNLTGRALRAPSVPAPGTLRLRPVAEGMHLLVIKALVLALICLNVANGAIYQIQLLYTGNTAPITGVYAKGALLFLLIAGILLGGSIRKSSLWTVILLFLVFLVLHATYSYFMRGRQMLDILQGYNVYYFGYFLLACIDSQKLEIRDGALEGTLIVLFLICAGFGIAQYITQEPLLFTESADDNFKVVVWQNIAYIRTFSLFLSPGEFGAFCSFVVAFATALLVQARDSMKRLVWFLLLGLALFSCYTTATRAQFVAAASALLSAYILASGRLKFLSHWLPLVSAGIGLAAAAYAYYRSITVGVTFAMDNAESFAGRLDNWRYYLSELTAGSGWNALLGYGLAQNDKIKQQTLLPPDSLYFAVILHIGVVGLILFFAVIWSLWQRSRRQAVETASPLAIAAAAMIATIFGAGIFTINFHIIPSFVYFAFFLRSRSRVVT